MKLKIGIDDASFEVEVEILEEDEVVARPRGRGWTADLPTPPRETAPQVTPSAGSVTSPIAGSVVAISCEPGSAVEAGAPLLVLEAMKMESTIPAPKAGIVADVVVSVGDAVRVGQVLVELET